MNGQPLILVVEQNLHNLELMDFYLKSLNLSCLCAKQGVRAVILAQTHQPDLILLDMMLPDLSGSQVIDYLKQNPKTLNIPIIPVIPLRLSQNHEHLFLRGINNYITKPYDFSKLELLLKNCLNQLHSSDYLSE